MPSEKRIKTSFPGVFYLEGKKETDEGREKNFYIRYRVKGKQIEKKVGGSIKDNMTAKAAAKILNSKVKQAAIENKSSKKPSNEAKDQYQDHPYPQIRPSDFPGLVDTIYLQDRKHLYEILATLFRSSSDGILVTDSKANIIACNTASSKLSGLNLNELVGINSIDMVNRGIIDKSVSMEVIKKKRKVTQIEYIKKTGRKLLITGTPVLDEGGDIQFVVLNERDITQLSRLKAKLEKTRQISDKFKRELTEMNLTELNENEIIAESEKMKQIIKICLKLANLDVSNILIQGESGTGKGLLAKFIHKQSPRKNESFIKINCAAIPEALLEAELFGYETGAFTGASPKGKAGLFELSNHGTLFLDEIGDLPMSVQAKLLTYLDDNIFTRLGGTKAIQTDSMLIAATNRNLKSLVAEKQFRSDLFHRLNTFGFTIPPLRDRPEDINKLVFHYLEYYNHTYGSRKKLSDNVLSKFDSYVFNGNIRELKNIIKKSVVMCESDLLDEFILNEIRNDS